MTKSLKENKGKETAWMNRVRFIFCCLFFLACCLPMIGVLAGIKTPSLEKRTLVSRPELLIDQKLNMDYTSQFDAYFSGNFTFRTRLIAGWHHLNRVLLQQSGNARVIVGKNDWLFFRDTLADYLGVHHMEDVSLSRLDRLLHLQQSWLERRDIAWIFMVAPNKNSVYPQMMPDHLKPIHAEGNLDLLKLRLTDNQYLDLESLLIAAADRSDEPVYHRTDSHWNNYSARLVTQTFLAKASQTVPGLILITPADAPYRLERDWLGDLAIMMNPSGPEPDWQFRYDSAVGYQYDKTPRSLEDVQIGTHNSKGSGTLLMFRDSFANALIPLLSESFARVVYSRAVPLDYGLVESAQPDLVTLEIVERNLPLLLEKPPRLTADVLSVDDQLLSVVISNLSDQPLTLSVDDISLQVSTSGSWLKISGIWPAGTLQQSAVRVLVGLPSPSEKKRLADNSQPSMDLSSLVYYEASPIADDRELDWQNNGGFTIYLESVQWQTGSQPMRLYLQVEDRWLQADLMITLP